MQLSSGSHIPGGLLAAMTLRNENSRLGVPTKNPALHQGIDASKSKNAMGLQTLTTTTRVRSRCTGKERDSESGLDYFGARYYGSALGRFTNPDWSSKPEPVPYADFSNPQSLNQYAYVLNNPLSKSDLDGHVAGVDDVVEAGAVVVLGTAAVITAWEETPAGQRTVSNLASAASDSFSSNLHALKDTVTSWFSPKIKEKTSEKAGGQCEYCGTDTVKAKKSESGVTPPSNEQQTDHYDPKSKGGKDDESNAANSCRTCNREKSDISPKGTKWELPRFRKKPLPATASQTLPQ